MLEYSSICPLRSKKRLSTFLTALGAFCLLWGARSAVAQECCGEEDPERPCLLFLDDLFNGCACSTRDPYEDPIETDRHDFTQSARTVGRGVFQLEGGYSYFYKDNEEEIENSHTLPEMVLRYGLSDNIEFRLRWNYAWIFKSGEPEHGEELEDLDGAQDLIWGFKLQLTEQECCRPESAMRIVSSVPTGGTDFTTDGVEVGVDVVYAWELENGWELAGSTGVFRNGVGEFSLAALSGISEEGADDFAAWAQSVALGIPTTERTELYLEYFGIFSDGLTEDFSLGFVNAGVDFLITDNLVFDIRLGKGLTDDSDDFFSGVGGGVRY